MMRRLFPVIALLMLIAAAGCAVNPVSGRPELSLVSEQQEIELGKREYPQIRQSAGGDFLDNDLDRYVNEVGRRIAAVSHRPDIPFQFKVIDSSVPNAFALPGGPIAIHRGLLVSLENEAQLAAVLGHEIAHVTARHYVQSLSSSVLLNVGLVAVGVGVSMSGSDFGQPIMLGSAFAANMASMKFSRSHEEQSDTVGIEYMVRAGYDPVGAVQLQEYFYKVVEKEKKPAWLEGFFRTHPFSLDRMETNRRVVASIPRQPGWTLGEDEFRKRTAHLREVNEAYAPYDEGMKLASKGKDGEAMEKFNQAISLAPRQAPFFRERGALYLKKEEYARAGEDLRKSEGIYPDFYKTQYYLGLFHKKQGNKVESEKAFKESMKLLPTREAAYNLGRHYEETGSPKEAFRYLSMAVEGGGDDELGRDARKRWEVYVLRDEPGRLITAEVRPHGTGGPAYHTITVRNATSRRMEIVRISVAYVNAAGRVIGVQEVSVENVPPNKVVTVEEAGPWFVPAATSNVRARVERVTPANR